MQKILILEANPKKYLSLNDEINDLQSVIYRSSDRDNEFKIFNALIFIYNACSIEDEAYDIFVCVEFG